LVNSYVAYIVLLLDIESTSDKPRNGRHQREMIGFFVDSGFSVLIITLPYIRHQQSNHRSLLAKIDTETYTATPRSLC